MKFYNQACIFFTRADDQPGNETLGTTNHCFMLMRYPGGVMYYNSAPGGAVSRFKFRDDKYGEYDHPIPEVGSKFEASRLCELFPDFRPYIMSTPILKNFSDENLADHEKPQHSNLSNSLADLLHYFSIIRRYQSHMKPVFMLDVCVFKYPEQDFFYGRPMFCHNFLVQVLGIQPGNVLTSLHLKNRLVDWSGKSNFYTGVFLDNEQKES